MEILGLMPEIEARRLQKEEEERAFLAMLNETDVSLAGEDGDASGEVRGHHGEALPREREGGRGEGGVATGDGGNGKGGGGGGEERSKGQVRGIVKDHMRITRDGAPTFTQLPVLTFTQLPVKDSMRITRDGY